MILERISALRPHEQLTSVRREVAENVVESDLKDQVLGLIDDRLAAERERSEQLERELKSVDQTAVARTEQMRLNVELKERRSKIYKSLLERDTVAGAIGPVLLFMLAGSLVVAMFTHTPFSSAVSDSFLLILGYFFGQTTSQKTERTITKTPEAGEQN
ncbi:hypothetical protein [Kitasatospora sp. NPDC059571]|uniref:hypothetical protein n=1 Tax=Kitasatospora sp. NPDC059571 TaxID=3346871 RepID=UPI0036AF63F3